MRALQDGDEHLEDRLSPPDRERFEAHVADCEYCDTYLEQMRQTIPCASPAARGIALGGGAGRPLGRLPGMAAGLTGDL